jgi:hypothetical protein
VRRCTLACAIAHCCRRAGQAHSLAAPWARAFDPTQFVKEMRSEGHSFKMGHQFWHRPPASPRRSGVSPFALLGY